jgi:hypothetical protein
MVLRSLQRCTASTVDSTGEGKQRVCLEPGYGHDPLLQDVYNQLQPTVTHPHSCAAAAAAAAC